MEQPFEILRIGDMERVTGLSRTAIYEAIARGELPKPVKLTSKASGWLAPEIAKWQRARMAERDGEKAA